MRRKMPWYEILPESIKAAARYLIQHYLGQYLDEKISRDQLTFNVFDGVCSLENIRLSAECLNSKLADKQNWPLEFIDGQIQKFHMDVPYLKIFSESVIVEITGLNLTLQPKQRDECATSMFESMWNSMTSSLNLAEECVKLEKSSSSEPIQSVEYFASIIESILERVKVKFIDTTITIEHVPKGSQNGVGIVININTISYKDESGNDPPQHEATNFCKVDDKKAYFEQSYTARTTKIEGISIYTLEFPSNSRTYLQKYNYAEQYFEENDSLKTLLNNRLCDDNNSDNSSSEYHEIDDDNRYIILCGKFIEHVEVIFRLKRTEELQGPKVSIELNFGSLLLFLSPRQVYILFELINGLTKPDIEDHTNIKRKKYTGKPLSDEDYKKIEKDLQQQLNPLMNIHQMNSFLGHGWSTAPLDDSEDNFLPMRNTKGGLYDSTISDLSSMDSSLNSSMISSCSELTSKTKKRLHKIDTDPTAEISRFDIHIDSLGIILLHEDLIVQALENDSLIPSSVKQMQSIAEKFFKKTYNVVFKDNKKDFKIVREIFDSACDLNHLRLLASPIHLEGDEKTTFSAFSITGYLEAKKLELIECLYESNNVEHINLLIFDTTIGTSPQQKIKPSLKILFKYLAKCSNNGTTSQNFGPKTELILNLNKCTLEFDITIIDRISALLNNQPICLIKNKNSNVWNIDDGKSKKNHDSRMDIKISSLSSINVKLRFPKPDFRPSHDMNRMPWWKRNVRPDYLLINLNEFNFQTSIYTDSNLSSNYSIQSKNAEISYYENENTLPILICKCGNFEKCDNNQDSSLLCKLNIKINSLKLIKEKQLTQTGQESMINSMSGLLENRKYPIGPFSSKKVVHQSDTSHLRSQNDDPEELLIPGEKHEIDDFISKTIATSKVHIEIYLPTVTMQLLSKHTYELIYNRINNDLLLWEPSAPKPRQYLNKYENFNNLNTLDDDTQEVYTLCKSGIPYSDNSSNSSSFSSDTDEDSDINCSNIYYSAYGTKSKYNDLNENNENNENSLTLNLIIGNGILCLLTPVRDATTNNVIPEQYGEFLINVENSKLFLVNGYMGDKNLGFLCLQIFNTQLNHCELIPFTNDNLNLNKIDHIINGKHLHSTIYKSESGILTDCKSRGGNREMLTLAVKIQNNHETHHVKSIIIAIGFNKVTLRHRMCSEPNSWLTQLLDFFNINDYPIPGYHTKDILTELYMHFWDSSIDYRPIYLPLRCVITLGTFRISSHLTTDINTTTLRFIAEECGLFISNKGFTKNNLPYQGLINLKRDYINVIEMGLFEISLKTTDKKNCDTPHIDLRASNNIITIRTCSDSGRALTQLIKYFANDGDLIVNDDIGKDCDDSNGGSSYSSPQHQSDQTTTELINVESYDINSLSKNQQEHLNDLITDALEENIDEDDDDDNDNDNDNGDDDTTKKLTKGKQPLYSYKGAKLYYFPDENHVIHDEPNITTDLGKIQYHHQTLSDTDDDFCFINEDTGYNVPKSGHAEINWLTNEPIRLIDNYFSSPKEKLDPLKTPKNFPIPIMKYTLCEMSIIWKMYGGSDFDQTNSKLKEKKNVNFIDKKDSVYFSNNKNKNEILFNINDRKKTKRSWLINGGINRDHNILMELQLNKIRFQHEVYPETSTRSSRQVLIVSEFEIRDRLQSSQINKFLCQFTSQTRPKQSNANMMMIKTVNIKPDPKLKREECCLKISILPLRFNIDQDALLFLIKFFNELGGSNKEDELLSSIPSSRQNTPIHQPPVMSIGEDNEEKLKEQAKKIVDQNLLILLEENKTNIDESNDDLSSIISTNSSGGDTPIYFKKILFTPDVPIRLDYQGKHVDLSHGPLPGLLMGLGQLNYSELTLKRIYHRHGILGVEKLFNFLLQEWLSDIKKNQLPRLLGGVGPMYSFVQLFQGIRDLFWLPIEQYKKDGRFLRGLHRGANSFTTSTAMAALELTTRLIHLIQITAETAFDMLTPGPSVRINPKTKARRRRYNQPKDIREGVTNAYKLVKEGIEETADNIIKVASHEHEQKGYSGAVGGVIRQIPPTIIKPIIIASEATNNVLGGMRCQLLPDARKEVHEKWRTNDVNESNL